MIVEANTPPTEPSGRRSSAVDRGFFEPRNAGADDLLAAQVHERHAGIALHVGGDAADLARAGDDVAVVVAPQIKPGFLELRVVDVLDPLAAAARPLLIDQKLVVILDQELGGVARLLLGVAEHAARQHEVAGKDRGAALADEALADDERLDAVPVQIERGIAAGCTSTDDHDFRGQDLHYSTHTAEPARIEPLLSSVMRGLDPDLIRASIFLRRH